MGRFLERLGSRGGFPSFKRQRTWGLVHQKGNDICEASTITVHPVSPYPLNFEGGRFTPKIRWWSVRNPLFYSVFWGPPRTCVKMEPFVLLAFSPSFIAFFASKLAIFPIKHSVLRAWEGHFRPAKDKWWIRGSKTPKRLQMPLKQGKASQDHNHNWLRYRNWPQIGPKIATKQGKKDKWCGHGPPPKFRGWDVTP